MLDRIKYPFGGGYGVQNGRRTEDKATVQQSLRQVEDEKRGALSQNRQLAEELDGLRRQLESKDAELRKLQNELQRSQRPGHDGESPNEAADENQKRVEREPRLREPHQNSVDDSSTSLSPHRQLAELNAFRRQLSRGAESKGLQNEPQRLQKLGDEGESLRGAAAEIRLLKEQVTRLRASHRKTIDEFTALSQSYQREQEDKAAIQQALRREKEGQTRALSRNEQLTGERDNLVRQLESKDGELTKLRDALQRKDESYKKRAEENSKLREEIVQLEASYWRAVDESATLPQLLKREQEDKVAAQQSLLQETNEKAGALSRNEQLIGERDDLVRQLESKDGELTKLQDALQRKDASYKKGAEENSKLREEIAQLEASYWRAFDESATLSQSLKREQEDKVAAQRSLLQEAHEKAGALSQNEQLTGELEDLRRQLESNDVKLGNLCDALQHEEESSKGGVEENRKLREEIDQLEASYRKAVDESTAFSELLKQEQEDKEDILRTLRRGEAERAGALSQNEQLTGMLDELRDQLESNDVELTGFRKVLRHHEESLRGAAEKNLKLKEEVAQLRESRQKTIDESVSLSRLLKREKEDKAEVLRSLHQWEDEKAGAILQNEQLAGVLDGLRHQLESKDTELENLRIELRRAEEENLKLKEQFAQFRAAHQRAVDESTALSQSLKQAWEEMRTMQQSLHREREEKDTALPQSQRPIGDLDDLRQQVESKEVELKEIQKEFQHSQMERDKLSALLKANSRELKGAQVRFIKPDMLPGAQVIALINALNIEILRTSALILDSFDFARQSEHADEMKEASARTSEYTGATLARLLGAMLYADDPLLIRIALQGVTVEFSRRIIMSWDLDGLQVNRPLAALYDSVRETETQAVGGCWRALTRAHAQKVALQGVHATLVGPMSDALVSVLVTAGCAKSYEETHRMLTQNCSERISNIVKMALRLNKALGEEVMSVDLESVSVTSGERFDEATMVNFDSYGKNLEGQIVLCTSALGLQKSEKVIHGDTVELEVTTLLKPEVVLESIANDLDMDEA